MNSLSKHLKKSVELVENKVLNSDEIFTDLWRLGYHLMPPIGWLNDPNGLCFFNGEYHIFFQYSPFNVKGELKFWGLYKSKNLIDWQYFGTPIIPDQEFDCHGAYSGSALVEDETLYLYYTGNVKYTGEDYDYITNGRGSNTVLAISKDGLNIDSKKCIMRNEDYPKNLTCHVRDPKVWKEDNSYYMVQGARTKEDKGIVLLFKSNNKIDWKLENIIESKEKLGYMWECPDLFNLDGKTVLSISPQGVKEEGYKYQNIYQSGYYILDGDFKTSYSLKEFIELDRGFDFYAPQTFLDEKGRRILIGWFGMADCDEFYTNKTIEKNWQHALTLPRVLNIKEEKLYQNPIEEIENLRNTKLSISSMEEHNVEACFELIVDKISENLEILLEKNVIINYDAKNKLFSLKFNDKEIGANRTTRSVELEKCNKVRVFVDYSSIEIFINDGEEVFSTRFYPKDKNITIQINTENTENTLWKLNRFALKF